MAAFREPAGAAPPSRDRPSTKIASEASVTKLRPPARKGPARKFDHDEAKRLREQGMTFAAIARALGVTQTAIQYATKPDMKARMDARSAAYQRRGTCVDCGTQISSNSTQPATRCVSCSSRVRATSVRADGWMSCSACKEWKPPESFHQNAGRDRITRGHRHDECKACSNARRSAYRQRGKVPCEACGAPVEGKGRANTRVDPGTGERVRLDPNRPYLCRSCSMRRVRRMEREGV